MEYTEQDLSFRLSEELEIWFDIRLKGNDELINVYEAEHIISLCLENTGLRLRISHPNKFESTNP